MRNTCLAVVAAFILTAAQAAPPDALATVKEVVRQTVDAIEQARRTGNNTQAEMRAIIEQRIEPNFLVEDIARTIMGKYWLDATPSQRQRFIDAFRDRMLQIYSRALQNYDDQQILFQRSVQAYSDNDVLVRSLVVLGDNSRIPVLYALQRTDANAPWRIYDLTIDGVSMVGNYRASFARQFATMSIDDVINTFIQANIRNDQSADAKL